MFCFEFLFGRAFHFNCVQLIITHTFQLGNENIAKLLIESKANVNGKTFGSKYTPLHETVGKGETMIFEEFYVKMICKTTPSLTMHPNITEYFIC